MAQIKSTKQNTNSGNKSISNTKGQITEILGQGDDAKNSIVYLTLERCFVVGGLITLGLFCYHKCWSFPFIEGRICAVDEKSELVKDVISIWEIFIPVITLALGYVFGKGK